MKFDALFLVLALMIGPVIGSSAYSPTADGDPKESQHVVILGKDAAVEGFPADAIFEEGDLVNGRREGVWKRYHDNGNVRSEIHYVHDAPFGHYKVFSDEGRLLEEGRWEHGVNVGHLRRYWPNGTVRQMLTFDQQGVGQGQQRYFHDNGQLEMLVDLLDGQEEGDVIRLDREGRVTSRTTYRSGRMMQRDL